MAFHMMYTDRRHAPGECHRLRAGRANQQGADEPGPRGVSYRIDLARLAPGFGEHLANQGEHAFDVITRGQLRDHPAIDPVQVDLTEQGIVQQAMLAVVQRDTGFVA